MDKLEELKAKKAKIDAVAKAKKAQVNAQIKLVRAKHARQVRRQDARRKILLGSAMLSGLRLGKIPRDVLPVVLNLVPDKDRALFIDGEPNAETLAAMEELNGGGGTEATLEELRAMIHAQN